MLLARKSVLAAKIETSVGQAIALSASDAVFNVYNAKMKADISNDERTGQGSYSRIPSAPGARSGTCTFETDLIGGASDPAWASTFLPACGYVGTDGVYAPVTKAPGVSGGPKTLTIALYEDGRVKKLRGAMGTAVFRMQAGKAIRVAFTFRGIWDAPADASILTPTFVTTKPLRFASSAIAIGSWNPTVAECALDLGNNVIMREDSADVSGFASAAITDMMPKGNIDPEALLVATSDNYGAWLAGTEAALSIALGATGNAVAFAAPKLQFMSIDDGDRNLLRTDPIEFQLNRSASAGDDHLTITFS